MPKGNSKVRGNTLYLFVYWFALAFLLGGCGGGGGGSGSANDVGAISAKALATAASILVAGGITIDDFDNRSTIAPWNFISEGGGASGSVVSGSGYGGTNGLALNYNLTCPTSQTCGQYAAATLALAVPVEAGAAIGLLTKSPANVQLVVRVIDSSGQTLQYRPVRPLEGYEPSTWYPTVVELNKPEGYWGGVNNGIVQGQIKGIWIIADHMTYPATGTLSVDNITVLREWTTPGPVTPVTGAMPVDDFENRVTMSPWVFWGAGGANAQGSITSGPGYESERALALNYNLTCTGQNCGQYTTAIMSLSQPLPAGMGLSLMTKSPANIQLVIRVIDQSGQTLQYRPERSADGRDPNNWVQTIIELNKPEAYWGGASNGIVQNKIVGLWILAADPSSYPASGTLTVDNIVVLSNLDIPLPAGSVIGAVSIDDFQNRSTVAPWTFWNSGTGASSSLSLSSGYGSTRALALNYNFSFTCSGCGKNAAASLRLPYPVFAGAALSLMTKSPADIQPVVRVIDQSGQTLQYRPIRPVEGYNPDTWYRAVVALNRPEAFWGGANNGVVQGQVNAIWIVADNPAGIATTGSLMVDDIVMLSQWTSSGLIASVEGVASIDSFENRASVGPWTTWSEGGSGAAASVTSIAGDGGGRGLALNYNFDCTSGPGTANCGQYVAATLKLPQPVAAGAAIRFRARSAPEITLTVRVVDQTGQTLQYRAERPLEGTAADGWYQVIVPLALPDSYWGGANNGVVQGQINSVWIMAGSPRVFPLTGTVALDNLVALSSLNGQYALDSAVSSLTTVHPDAENIGSRIGVAYNAAQNAVATLDSARSAGISFIRVDLFWNWIEITRGVYDFSNFDSLLNAAEARGLGVLFILAYGNPLYDVKTPSGITAFANFARAAATRYAGRNVRFEIWNEQDSPIYWGASANPVLEYATLSKATAAAIHQVNPLAQVTTGGTAWFNFEYLTQALAAGFAQDTDAIGVHGYREGGPETLVEDMLLANWWTQRILGKNLPLWNTEWGYSLGTIPGDGHSSGFRKQQAVLIARQMLSQWTLNAPMSVWFNLVDDCSDKTDRLCNFGLLDSAYSEKPTIQSLRTLTAFAQGKANKGLVMNAPPGLHIMKLEGAADNAFIAWNSLPNAATTLNIPSAGSPLIVDYLGAPTFGIASGNQLRFTLRDTDGPIYIRYPK